MTTPYLYDSRYFSFLWIVLGIIVCPFVGLRTGFVESKMMPNQGIRLSVRNALLSGLVGGTLVGTVVFVVFALVVVSLMGADLGEVIAGQLRILPYTMLAVGPSVILCYGGLDVIQHYVLRLILRVTGQAPWRYACFFNYAIERIFLRKVGGGYIFIHRLLQEYFASLYEGGKKTT